MWKLLNLLPWRRRRMERELERELRYHVDRRIDDLRAVRLSDADARRQVALEFGGVLQVREEVRETWLWRWLDERPAATCDTPAALLRRSPAFAATALLSLALGIGASAAVFSLIDQVLLRRLPVQRAGSPGPFQLERHTCSSARMGYGYLMSYPLCRDLQEQRQVFDGVFCRHPTTVNLSTGQQARTGARRDRVGLVLQRARRAARARAADRSVG